MWDLPTRLFHWSLVVLVCFSFVSAKIGGAWTEWHFRSGYSILALLLFRLLWGFAGSRYARFAAFVRSPRAVLHFLRGPDVSIAGHSPAGGWSVLAMLSMLLAQASAGLFANDSIASEGPLARFVSSATSDRLTTLHRWGENVVIVLVSLHVLAVVYIEWRKGRPIIGPMISGDAMVAAPSARDDMQMRVRAAVIAAWAAALVAFVVTL